MGDDEAEATRVPFEGLRFEDFSRTVAGGELIVMDDRGALHSAPFTPLDGRAVVTAAEIGHPTNVVYITLETTPPHDEVVGVFGREPQHASVGAVFTGTAVAIRDAGLLTLVCNQVELRTD